MSISVSCKCGQRFAAPDQLAGKTVKCPKCAQPLKIPPASASAAAPAAQKPAGTTAKQRAASAAHELFDEIGLTERGEGLECPSCGHMLPHEAILCVNCGFNFKLKRRLQTLGTEAPLVSTSKEPPKKLSEVEKLLVRAEDDLENEPAEQERGYGTRSSAWLLMLVMVLISAAVIGGGVMFFQHMEGKKAEETAVEQPAMQP